MAAGESCTAACHRVSVYLFISQFSCKTVCFFTSYIVRAQLPFSAAPPFPAPALALRVGCLVTRMDGVKMRRPAGGSPLPAGKPSASASPPSPPGGRARSSSASSQASSGGWSSFSSGGDAWLSPSSLAALLPAWRVVDAAARRHGLGTFWLPIMVALRLASPTAAWFLAHGAALVALSLAAHALYAAEARWPVLAGGARTAARCATGCLR